jgi:hypothetical protein
MYETGQADTRNTYLPGAALIDHVLHHICIPFGVVSGRALQYIAPSHPVLCGQTRCLWRQDQFMQRSHYPYTDAFKVLIAIVSSTTQRLCKPPARQGRGVQRALRLQRLSGVIVLIQGY